MKQYNLKISQDYHAENPRNYCNIGNFLTHERGRVSPDQDKYLEDIILQAYSEYPKSVDDHIKKIKRIYKKQFGENLVLIAPISKHEHGSINYYLGDQKRCQFDSCLAGFYIITKNSLRGFYGSEKRPKNKTLLKYIKAEIQLYNQWVNGEVYYFELEEMETKKINGKEFTRKEIIDESGNYYQLEHIREYLPDSFKNEDLNNYLI